MSGVSRYTAASSARPSPTSRSGSSRPCAGLIASNTSWRSPGAILDAQPAQAAYDVSRRMSLSVMALRSARGKVGFEEREERHREGRARALAMCDQVEGPSHRDAGDRQCGQMTGAEL